MSEPRRQRVIDAAFETFMRYGFRRTTMDDIAQQVGLSRPTLYTVFPNKEAIFRAVVEDGQDRMLAEIEAGLPSRIGLADQLTYTFEVWLARPFEATERSPAAEELMTSSFDFAAEAFDQGGQHLIDLLGQLISAAVTDPTDLRPPAQDLARLLVAASRGCKTTARDADDLRNLLRDLIDLTVAGLPLNGARIPD